MSAPTWLLIEVTPHESQILPALLSGLPMSGGMRYRSTICLAKIALPPKEIRERSAQYPLRLAIGPKEIWEKFPECRPDFVANLQRNMPTGLQTIDIALKYALAGDVIPSREPSPSPSTRHEWLISSEGFLSFP
jgi:hypothetical protein